MPKAKKAGGETKPPGSDYFGPPKEQLKPGLTPVEEDADQTEFEKSVKVSVSSLKAKLDKESLQYDQKTKELVNMISDRVKNGRDFGLRDYRVYAAIDEVYNTAFKQITPTLIQKIVSRRYKEGPAGVKEIMDAFTAWGLNFDDHYDVVKGEDGVEKRILKNKSIVKIFVPLVKAYLTIRAAKLYTDRDNTPLLKYEPSKITDESLMLGEVMTEIVRKITQQYGYRAVFRQMIHQALKYGTAIAFPIEAWHTEETPDTDGDGKHAVKEGLRYDIPHPTKMAWDLMHRLSTLNTDTGCEWIMHWRLVRYSDIQGNPYYWKKDKISTTATDWWSSYRQYFSEVFPCVMQPVLNADTTSTSRDDAQVRYYNTSDKDKAVFVTDLFCKLTPSEWGLGDYEFPLWFRFVVANDDTVIFAEPLAYCPGLYMGYDPDENQSRNSSMALEILPFQDTVSNVLTQWLASLRQNLKNIIPYDKDQVTPTTIAEVMATAKDIENFDFMPYSARQSRMAERDPSKIFQPIQLPRHDLSQFVITIDRVLNIMERCLNMSASETGSAGSHIQTAEEIRTISSNVSTRVAYTGSFVDDFIEAWKRQLYLASKAYMDDEFIVEVSEIADELIEALNQLGFTVKQNGAVKKSTKVSGSRRKIVLETYMSEREGQDRINSPQIAQVMMQTVQAAAKTGLMQMIGPEQIIEIFNRASRLAGGPRDFKLKLLSPSQTGEPTPPEANAGAAQQQPQQAAPAPSQPNPVEQIMAAVQQQVAQMGEAVMQNVMQQVTEGLQPLVQSVKEVQAQVQEGQQVDAAQQQRIDQQQAGVEQLAQLVLRLEALLKTAAVPPEPAPPALPNQPTVPPELPPQLPPEAAGQIPMPL